MYGNTSMQAMGAIAIRGHIHLRDIVYQYCNHELSIDLQGPHSLYEKLATEPIKIPPIAQRSKVNALEM